MNNFNMGGAGGMYGGQGGDSDDEEEEEEEEHDHDHSVPHSHGAEGGKNADLGDLDAEEEPAKWVWLLRLYWSIKQTNKIKIFKLRLFNIILERDSNNKDLVFKHLS